MRDFSTEIEAVHKRQNLLEEREIRNSKKIGDLENSRDDQRDWIVRALGPVQQTLLSIQEDNKVRFESIGKQLRKLFARLDEHGMGRGLDRKKQAKRKPRSMPSFKTQKEKARWLAKGRHK